MASVNKVIIVGKLGRDVEAKAGQSTSYAFFSVATDDYIGKGADGKAQTETTWHDVKCFGKQADYIGQYGKKGTSVYIEGRIQKSKDKESGAIHVNVIASQIVLFGANGGGNGNGNGGSSNDASAQPQAGRGAARAAAPPATASAAQAVPAGDAADDDLPF